MSAKDSKLFEDLKTTVNAGLGTASGVATDMYDASRNDPALLNTYGKTIQATNQFADAMLTVEPGNFFAINLKTYNLYLDAERSLKSDPRGAALNMQLAGKQAAQLEQSSDIRLRTIAARTYAGIAEIFTRLNRPEAAGPASKKATELASQLSHETPPDDDFTPRTLALTYNMLGTAEEHAEHWDRAVGYFQNEIALEQQAYNLYPKTDARRFSIAHDALEARNRIGSIDLRLHRDDAARQIYEEKSLPIARLLEQNAGPTDKLRAQRDLWNVQEMLARIAGSHKTTRPDAVKDYSAAVATGEKIVATDRSAYARRKLEQELLSLAQLQKLAGRFPEARAAYKKYLSRVQQRASEVPDAATTLDLANAYEALANFELHHGDKTEALANYAATADWLTKSGAFERLASVERKLGHLDRAVQASQKSIDAFRKRETSSDPYSLERQLQSGYEELALSKAALGDKAGAKAALDNSLNAARRASAIAANQRAAEALGSLAWAEILNNHAADAVHHAEEAVAHDPFETWLKVNLLHACLLANQLDRAREIYLANRGEQVYDDLFEIAVLDDFNQLRALGLDRGAMSEFEKLRASE